MASCHEAVRLYFVWIYNILVGGPNHQIQFHKYSIFGIWEEGSFVKYVKGYYQVAEKLDKSAMLQTCFPHGFRICTCKDNTPMVNYSWIYSSKKVQVYSYMKHSGRIWSTLLLLTHTFTLSQVYYEYQNCQKLPVNQTSVVRHICESIVVFYLQAWNLAGL